jgi:hypothetical protein
MMLPRPLPGRRLTLVSSRFNNIGSFAAVTLPRRYEAHCQQTAACRNAETLRTLYPGAR